MARNHGGIEAWLGASRLTRLCLPSIRCHPRLPPLARRQAEGVACACLEESDGGAELGPVAGVASCQVKRAFSRASDASLCTVTV